MHGSREGTGGPDPPDKSQNIGFLRNTGPDPLKITKLPKPAFNGGPSFARQQNANQIAFCWWANDGPYIVVFGSCIPLSTKKQNKNVFFYQIWSPTDKAF